MNNKLKTEIDDFINNKNDHPNSYLFYNSNINESSLLEMYSDKVNIIYKKIDFKKIDSPYYPFLEILKNNINSIEKTIKNSKLYNYNNDLFINFFNNSLYYNDDELIDFDAWEIEYEKLEIINSIIKIYNEVFKNKKCLIVLSNIENLNHSSINLITKMIESNSNKNILFLFSYNKSFLSTNSTFASIWENLLKIASNKNILITNIEFSNSTCITNDLEKYDSLLKKVQSNLDILIDISNFVAYDDISYFIEDISNFIINSSFENSKKRLYIYNLIQFYYYKKNFKQCIDYCNYYLDNLSEKISKKELCIIYYRFSRIYFKNQNFELAKKFANKSYKISIEIEDHKFIISSFLLKYILCNIKEKISLIPNLIKKIKIMKEKKLHKQLIFTYHILCSVMENHLISKEMKLAFAKDGLNISKQINNNLYLGFIEHSRSLVYLNYNDLENSIKSIKNSLKYIGNYCSAEDIIKTLNGLAYCYINIGEYKKTMKSYEEIIRLFDTTNNYLEAAITIFNIAYLYDRALNFEKALFFYELLINFLESGQIEEFPYHTKFEVYLLLGSAYLNNNQLSNAYIYYEKIINSEQSLGPEGELFEKLFFSLYYSKNSKIDLAEQTFQQLFDSLSLNDFRRFSYPNIYYHYGKFLKSINKISEAKKAFLQGIEFSIKQKNKTYKSILENEILNINDKNYKTKSINLKNLKLMIYPLLEFAKTSRHFDLLYKNLEKQKYLNKIQSLLINENSSMEILLEKISKAINNYFLLDFISISIRNKNKIDNLYITDKSKMHLIKDIYNNCINENVFFVKNTSLYSYKSDFLFSSEIKNTFNSFINFKFFGDPDIEVNIFYASTSTDFSINNELKDVLAVTSNNIFLKLLSQELKNIVLLQNLELENSLKMVKLLFDNSEQGFLSIDEKLIIDKEYGQECKKIFNKDISGKNLISLFLLEPKEYEFLNMSFIKLFKLLKAKKLKTFKVYVDLLPKIIEINSKTINLDYKVITNNSNYKIMIILTDITEKIKLEKKLEEEKNNLKMIVEVISNTSDFLKMYYDFCDFSKKLNNNKNIINKLNRNNINEFYRTIHTFKGNFSQFNLLNTSNNLHQFENIIENIKEEHFEIKDVINRFKTLNTLINKDINIIKTALGDSFFSENKYIKIEKEKLDKLKNIVISNFDHKKAQQLIHKIDELYYVSMKKLLLKYTKYIMEIATKKEKEIFSFNVTGSDILVNPKKYDPFINSLVHIFRNIVDHGIETPEERMFKNKISGGTINCNINEKNDKLCLSIKDDGNGIDLKNIKNKLFKLHIDYSNLNDFEIINHIFSDGFSTNYQVNSISGRGIGLSSVKNEVEKLGGIISVKSEKNKFTEFKIVLPL